MKVLRAELLATCAALVICAAMTPSAQAADLITKAPKAEQIGWWYEGFVEVGGRFYVNDPDRRKLARFYRYEDWTPGVFGNFYVGAHRTGPDPFDVTAWGKNVGYDDQAFELNVAKPGTYYMTFGWDETPHNYSFGAQTTYSPIGGNVLSTPKYPFPPTGPTMPAFNTFDLGFRRDTASAQGRWTPTDNWDITADYSHMRRSGTQALSALTFVGTAGNPTNSSVQLPKPVDDSTQNGNVKAEYAGSSPWGKPFNIALGYGISVYNNDVGCGAPAGTSSPAGGTNCLTFQNPWTVVDATRTPPWNRYSLPPDNQAYSFSASGGIGLPWNSRYMGTVQYTWMTQNDPFLPSSTQPAAVAALSRSSLGGDARTTLINNVLNTQITSNLTSNLRYRYYDYRNNTAPMTITGVFNRPDTTYSAAVTVDNVPVNFNKQNASGELVYRPWKWLDVGAAYEWERWRRDYADADDVTTTVVEGAPFTAVTNENAGRAFFDAKWGWSTLRTSVRYGERRFQGAYINASDAANSFRTIDLQNKNSTIVKSSWAINVTDTVTFTPVGGYRLDDYPADGRAINGISKFESWNAGGDISWAITPMAALYVSYLHEDGIRNVYNSPQVTAAANSPARVFYRSRDVNDVIIVGGKYTAIPDKLYLNASYTYSRGLSRWDSDCGPTGLCVTNPQPVYPDIHNINQRIDAWAKYMLDPTFLRNAGFLAKTQPYVKARVVYERNSNDSWQNVEQTLGWAVSTDATTQRAIFLGMPNPNYDVIVGMLSFGAKW